VQKYSLEVKMNNKGQTIMLAILTAIIIFIVGMLMVNFFKDEIDRARNATNLDCANTGVISDGTKLTCLAVDIVIPYFIITVISIAGGLITARVMR